jgi:RNA polymerase sigma-70 factor (ECF subfamily)
MPTTNGDVNAALAAHRCATDLTRSDLQSALIEALEHYAKRIVWLKLHQERPEIVNEAVQYVMAHLGDFRGESKFSTWVFSIVQRFCYRELEVKISNKEVLFSDYHSTHQVERLASYELDGDARITLDRLREALSDDENNLIDRKLEGYTNAEIAESEATSTTAIEGRWRRLCAKLRQNETKRIRTYPTQQSPT